MDMLFNHAKSFNNSNTDSVSDPDDFLFGFAFGLGLGFGTCPVIALTLIVNPGFDPNLKL